MDRQTISGIRVSPEHDCVVGKRGIGGHYPFERRVRPVQVLREFVVGQAFYAMTETVVVDERFARVEAVDADVLCSAIVVVT